MAKTIKVFLSSSFQDMHEERDYLKRHAFANLRTELESKGMRFQVLDLRGSTADPTLSEEEAVLRMCLRGVEDCVPRMVTLLGDRYGWIPYGPGAKHEDAAAAFRAQSAVEEISNSPDLDIDKAEMSGRSVTHLEIYYGLKRMDKQHMFFYQRQGLPYDTMSEKTLDIYRSDVARQEGLVTEIRGAMAGQPGNFSVYQAGWDPHRERVTNLKALSDRVYADLRESLRALLDGAVDAGAPADAYEEMLDSMDNSVRFYHDEMNRLSAMQLGDEMSLSYTAALIFAEYVEGKGKSAFMHLAGASGSGVTTTMVQTWALLHMHDLKAREKGEPMPYLLCMYAADAEDAPALSIMLLALTGEIDRELARHARVPGHRALHDRYRALVEGFEEKATEDFESMSAMRRQLEADAVELLHLFLKEAVGVVPVVLVLSDIHLLTTDGQVDRTFAWLQALEMEGVTVVFSTDDGGYTPLVPARQYAPESMADGQGREGRGYESARGLLASIAHEWGKAFEESVLDRAALAVCENEGTPLYARVIADYLLNMTGDEYRTFEGSDAYLRYMHAQLDSLPADAEGVYRLLLRRALEDSGEVGHAALGMLMDAKQAIPYEVLKDALASSLGYEVEDLELYALHGYFHTHMRRTRDELVWCFAHASMRRALRSLYGAEDRQRLSFYLLLTFMERHEEVGLATVFELPRYAFLGDYPPALNMFVSFFGHSEAIDGALCQLMRTEQAEAGFYAWLSRALLVIDDTEDLRRVGAALLDNPVMEGQNEGAYRAACEVYFHLLRNRLALEAEGEEMAVRTVSILRVDHLTRLLDCPWIVPGTLRWLKIENERVDLALEMAGDDPASLALCMRCLQERITYNPEHHRDEAASRIVVRGMLSSLDRPALNALMAAEDPNLVAFLYALLWDVDADDWTLETSIVAYSAVMAFVSSGTKELTAKDTYLFAISVCGAARSIGNNAGEEEKAKLFEILSDAFFYLLHFEPHFRHDQKALRLILRVIDLRYDMAQSMEEIGAAVYMLQNWLRIFVRAVTDRIFDERELSELPIFDKLFDCRRLMLDTSDEEESIFAEIGIHDVAEIDGCIDTLLRFAEKDPSNDHRAPLLHAYTAVDRLFDMEDMRIADAQGRKAIAYLQRATVQLLTEKLPAMLKTDMVFIDDSVSAMVTLARLCVEVFCFYADFDEAVARDRIQALWPTFAGIVSQLNGLAAKRIVGGMDSVMRDEEASSKLEANGLQFLLFCDKWDARVLAPTSRDLAVAAEAVEQVGDEAMGVACRALLEEAQAVYGRLAGIRQEMEEAMAKQANEA